MIKKFIAAAAAAAACFGTAAYAGTYTFAGVNCVTDGSPADITGAPLTEDITVTTSGPVNRKYAAVTDIEHNKEVGTFPASENFKADGSYIYLGAANANDGAVIALNMPEIKKGSRVELTFAKPTVTNNGSALRNTNDPYAYIKIADRFISINGDNFDAWRTESVITGEDTDKIEFYCDKWGAVAISRIDISDGDGRALYSLNIKSDQFANISVNGIKFCADSEGRLTIPSLYENEILEISADKDGYSPVEAIVTMRNADKDIELPLKCGLDAVYYESDFGNAAGVLELDGYYDLEVETMEVTDVFGSVTFKEGGYLEVNDMRDEPIIKMEYLPDGIYVNDIFITPKDNMEFNAAIDRHINAVVFSQNNKPVKINHYTYSLYKIGRLKGHNVSLGHIGISYPSTTRVNISAPELVYVTRNAPKEVRLDITPEYKRPAIDVKCSVSGIAGASITNDGVLTLPAGADGIARICVDYNNNKTYKEITVKTGPKIVSYSHNGGTLNLGAAEQFEIYGCMDETGAAVEPELRNFRSSNENVIKIDSTGKMTAVGSGTALISADAYTGVSNPVSAEYVVDCFSIRGITRGNGTAALGELVSGENITGYKVKLADGRELVPRRAAVPAAVIENDGTLITAVYDEYGSLRGTYAEAVSAGDIKPVPNEQSAAYLMSGGSITRLTQASAEAEGYVFDYPAGVGFEIAPVYEFANVGDVSAERLLGSAFENGLYDLTFKKRDTKRGDIYVNGFMAGNNVDQADADRKVTEGAEYTAEDIAVKNGRISVSMTDGSSVLDSVTAEKQPSWRRRPQRVYIIGDSLVCDYYGSFEREVGGGRTGWGQVIGNYLSVPVTNLAQSGQFAKGLYDTAFPSIIENGQAGDIALIECGYNDRSCSTREEMTECVKGMIDLCRAKGIDPVLVTPNASEHDYKPSVSWSGYVKDAAVDTGCKFIDLSKLSYDFLYGLYGDNEDSAAARNFNLTEVGGDTLHTSYAGAHKWASVVAGALKELGYGDIVDTDFSYTFIDTEGHEITAGVE